MTNYNIAIIGGGWYGCFITEYLLENYNNLNITIIEKNDDIFKGSSYYNQNRLHLGFHYPRSSITRQKCKKNFDIFCNKYKNIIEDTKKNYYVVANNSNINFENFITQYDNYNILPNTFLNNIENDIINSNEKYINFIKAKQYFKDKFSNKINFKYNYTVHNITNNNGIVKINYELEYNKVFNCTYNQIHSTTDVIYEKCLTLIYTKINEVPFDCLTIMDGMYSSIYKYFDNKYSLTNVQYTPLITSINNFDDVKNYNEYNLNEKIELFEQNIIHFYPDFKKNFIYDHFYESFKCKNISDNDNRDINIDINENIFNVWCGKISLIFELNDYIDKFIDI